MGKVALNKGHKGMHALLHAAVFVQLVSQWRYVNKSDERLHAPCNIACSAQILARQVASREV